MADDQATRRSGERKMHNLEEGWEAELWRRAYGVTRFRFAQAADLPESSAADARETPTP